MTELSPTARASRWGGWLPGLVLGAVNGFALLETGFIGLTLTAASLALIAWKGPRLLAAAGFVTGAGVVWTLLFGRVLLSCTPVDGCDARGIGQWVAVAALILAVGVAATIWAALRSQRRS